MGKSGHQATGKGGAKRPLPQRKPKPQSGGGGTAVPAEAAEILRMQQMQGNSFVQRQLNGADVHTRMPPNTIARIGPKAKAKPREIIKGDAAALLKAQHPKLKLPEQYVAKLQKILDAKYKIAKINEQIKPLEDSYYSVDVAKRERLAKKMSPYFDILDKYRSRDGHFITVPTKYVLAEDVIPKKDEKTPQIKAFQEYLYTTLNSSPIALILNPGHNPSTLLQPYRWTKYDWAIGNEDGLITMSALMRIQKFNLAYTQILAGELLEITERMLEIRRDMGNSWYEGEGKKLGEAYGVLWNTDVELGPEIGQTQGYADDPVGERQMLNDWYKLKGARAVVKDPEGWKHIFSLDPQLMSWDMKAPGSDPHVYLLDKGKQVTAERVTTKDGFSLERGAGTQGPGWRMEEILDSVEQFAVGAFFGDFVDDASVTMIFGQIVTGMIPIVGQLADVRDVAAGVHKVWTTGGKDGKLQLTLAIAGAVPLVGDGLKLAKKAYKAGGITEAVGAFKKQVQPKIGQAQESLAKQLADDPAGFARKLNMPEAELNKATAELAEGMAKATAEGGEAAAKFADSIEEMLAKANNDAGLLVQMTGGNWGKLAKALGATAKGKKVGETMQAWRVKKFDQLEKTVQEATGDFGFGLGSGVARMEKTGTPSYLSDMDVSFMGPHATLHRNTAINVMEEVYGTKWRDLLDADVFADPTRLHKFDDALTELATDPKLAKEAAAIQKGIASDSELNVLAKMLNSGKPVAEVEQLAKTLKVDMGAVTKRQKEIADIAADPEKFRLMELEMDSLHQAFAKAKGDPKLQAEIGAKMAKMQGKLNAAVEGPYMTPGGAMKHVTYREPNLRPMGPHVPLSPTMQYTAFLDDYYMLSGVLKKYRASGVIDEKIAKSFAKYAERMMITAGQIGGFDLAKSTARGLFDDVGLILMRARQTGSKVPLEKVNKTMVEAVESLKSQLDGMAKRVKEIQSNPKSYYLTVPSKAARAADNKQWKKVRAVLKDMVSELAKAAESMMRDKPEGIDKDAE